MKIWWSNRFKKEETEEEKRAAEDILMRLEIVTERLEKFAVLIETKMVVDKKGGNVND